MQFSEFELLDIWIRFSDHPFVTALGAEKAGASPQEIESVRLLEPQVSVKNGGAGLMRNRVLPLAPKKAPRKRASNRRATVGPQSSSSTFVHCELCAVFQRNYYEKGDHQENGAKPVEVRTIYSQADSVWPRVDMSVDHTVLISRRI
jgi:hypothetical protein